MSSPIRKKNLFFNILNKVFCLTIWPGLKFIGTFLLNRPYMVFFSVMYGCLLLKYYLNVQMNKLHQEKQLIVKSKEKLSNLELKYQAQIYELLKEKS